MDSSMAATVSGTPAGNAQTVYRTKIVLSSSLLGSSSGRARTAVNDIATLNFAANASFQAVIGKITLKFSGIAILDGTAAFTVDLIDTNTNTNFGSSAQETCTPSAGNVCSVTFSPQFTVDAGTTKSIKLRVNSSAFNDPPVAGSQSFSVLINSVGDFLVDDGSTSDVPLESTAVPFTVVNISYE